MKDARSDVGAETTLPHHWPDSRLLSPIEMTAEELMAGERAYELILNIVSEH
jgi:hypothetical protein